MLRLGSGPAGAVPVIEIKNAGLASSDGAREHYPHADQRQPAHFDGRNRRPIGTDSFVSVVAESCVVADGLTKVVLARGEGSHLLLQSCRATAYLHNRAQGWCRLGLGA